MHLQLCPVALSLGLLMVFRCVPCCGFMYSGVLGAVIGKDALKVADLALGNSVISR